MKNITVSLNPTYQCNLRCEFCYLSLEQLKDDKIISPEILFARLSEISVSRIVEHVDIYGGEIALIPEKKLLELFGIIRIFYQGKLNLITNLTMIPDYFNREDIEISVSWDSRARARHEEVLRNMKRMKKGFHVLMLASSKLMQEDPLFIIQTLNNIPNLLTVEIKPYSQSLFNRERTDFVDFERWVQKWIDHRKLIKFDFINLQKIKDCLDKKSSSWSDDHLYLTPSGEFSVLDFTDDGKEYFRSVKSIEGYENWCREERWKFSSDAICGKCEFLGHCLSEHLQIIDTTARSCSGFYNLLKNNSGIL